MLIVGLTGSIGMGKSTAAARFRARGIAVFDADAEVHRLYEGGAVQSIEAAFAGTTRDNKVDRVRLAAALMQDPDGFARLEAIVHPLVTSAKRSFLRQEAERGAAVAVLEIPLLFETGGEKAVDAVVVVSAGAELQRQRVLSRPGMTDAKLDVLLARQVPDAEKRARAHFVVDTSGSIAEARLQIDKVIDTLSTRAGKAYDQFWA